MSESRKFPRIRFAAQCVLGCRNADYKGRLENISISGALVRLEQCLFPPYGDENTLTVFVDEEASPLELAIEVVCTSFTLTGVKFLSCDAGTATRLGKLVENLALKQDVEKTERGKMLLYLSNYVRGNGVE
jgi:hypothetical protein